MQTAYCSFAEGHIHDLAIINRQLLIGMAVTRTNEDEGSFGKKLLFTIYQMIHGTAIGHEELIEIMFMKLGGIINRADIREVEA